MDIKVFNSTLLVVLLYHTCIFAEVLSDQQLLDLTKQTMISVKQAKTTDACAQAIQNHFGNLSDAEKTRAMALRLYDFDQNDPRRLHPDAGRVVTYIFDYDPMFIKDSTELRKMMASESDSRKFYLLYAIASCTTRHQRINYITETIPLLFRHEPLAIQSPDSEYYSHALSDASFFAYGAIVNELTAQNAKFIPPDEKLSFPEKISILIKWLKKNWPGCENIEVQTTATNQITRAVEAPDGMAIRKDKRPSSGTQSSKDLSSSKPWWGILIIFVILVLAVCAWIKSRSS